MSNIQTMTDAYIEAIYFTDTGDDSQPEPSQELTPLCRMHAYVSCRNFYMVATETLGIHPGHIDWRQAGHDLWLTRNGHGAGFWDRDDSVYGETPIKGEPIKDIFTAMAEAMGEHYSEFKEQA